MQFKTIILSIAIILGSITVAEAEPNNKHHQAHAHLQHQQVLPPDRQVSMPQVEEEAQMSRSGIPAEVEQKLDAVIREAKSHLGKPYVWGAHGPKAFDCTGFTSYVYKQFGITVAQGPAQINYGTPVKKEEMRKGDILFFTSPRSGSRMGHAGLVYDVDPETGKVLFIHASPKGIAIQELNGAYQRRYIGVHRIINDDASSEQASK